MPRVHPLTPRDVRLAGAGGDGGGVVYADHGTWWRFTGQERNAETALDWFGARYCRAIQDDSPRSTPR